MFLALVERSVAKEIKLQEPSVWGTRSMKVASPTVPERQSAHPGSQPSPTVPKSWSEHPRAQQLAWGEHGT